MSEGLRTECVSSLEELNVRDKGRWKNNWETEQAELWARLGSDVLGWSIQRNSEVTNRNQTQ